MKILIIGSGPIMVGQACEFDYSGTQACKVLKQEGHQVILLNSNPASIMTDPEFSDRTYLEEMNIENLGRIIAREKPDYLLPTVGGQTALNLAILAYEQGILNKYRIKLIGTSYEIIKKAEDRNIFRKFIYELGFEMPATLSIKSIKDIDFYSEQFRFPAIIRTSFSLGGSGCFCAHSTVELRKLCIPLLKNKQKIQIEEYLNGWKEYELEVIRDKNDNCITVCSIENINPIGVHTGDSITVAPAQTLSDKEFQHMRAMAFTIVRSLKVIGGANIQFAVNPSNGKIFVIEMNPRVSRSSALVSKATGYPIAKVTTILAPGYALDEVSNLLAQKSLPAFFEPALDYVVTKIPKFNFDKFPGISTLGMRMKSIGETIGVGRNFCESLMKALYGLEHGALNLLTKKRLDVIKRKLITRAHDSMLYVFFGLYNGVSVYEISFLSGIDAWFVGQINHVVEFLKNFTLSKENIIKAKRFGLSDEQLSAIMNLPIEHIKEIRAQLDVKPSYRKIDSSAGEFESDINYLYSTYGEACEVSHTVSNNKKILLIGSGPNRIGQGIEFDYCCVHALKAIKNLGYEAIIINNNPAVVSTDFDVSDKLYLEPLHVEHVSNVIDIEKPYGVSFQFGGQTAINLFRQLSQHHFKVLGPTLSAIDLCEDRLKFKNFLGKNGFPYPSSFFIETHDQIRNISGINFPLLVRPSYVIGGANIVVIKNLTELAEYAISLPSHHFPIVIEEFLESYKEVEVDGISDGQNTMIFGMIEHIEPVGIHSGDSHAIFPTFSLTKQQKKLLYDLTQDLIEKLNITGFFNVQFAIKEENIFVIEINLRCSRTIPFLCKALKLPLVEYGVKTLLGYNLKQLELRSLAEPKHYCIKIPVFNDVFKHVLGPQMFSTGEKMLIANSYDELKKKVIGASSKIMCLQDI